MVPQKYIFLPSDGGPSQGPRIHSLPSWLSWRNGIMFWNHGMFDGKLQMLFFLCTTTISPFHIFCSFMLENKIKLIPLLTLSPFATFQTLFSPLNRPYTNLTSKLKRRIRLSSFQNAVFSNAVFSNSHLAENVLIFPFYLKFSRSSYLHTFITFTRRIPVLSCLPTTLNYLQLNSSSNLFHCGSNLWMEEIFSSSLYHIVIFIWNI